MQTTNKRTGATALLLLMLLIPLLGLLAFSVDYGFLLFVRTDLQRVADQAAMAAARDLVPDEYGNQDTDAVRARVREYVELNLGEEFVVLDSDIEIGRYDPDTIYSSIDLLDNGTFDTVRVTLRRESLANASVTLYFARLLGDDQADVSASATAVLQQGRYLPPGTGVLPFAVEEDLWNGLTEGEQFSIYGDGKITDADGNQVPGNFGTVDIGPTNNSAAALREQIENGLSQNDLDSLVAQGAIPSSDSIDALQNPLILNADPGFSAGIKSAVQNQHGTYKLIPIYRSIPNVSQNRRDQNRFMLAGHRNSNSNKKHSAYRSSNGGSVYQIAWVGNGNGNGGGGGGGNNLNYEIIGWGAVQLVTSSWNGSQNTSITVQRVNFYNGNIYPNPDLSQQAGGIQGAYTHPVLVQ